MYDIVKEWHKDLAKRPGKRSDFGQTVTATAGDGSSTFKRLVKEERNKGACVFSLTRTQHDARREKEEEGGKKKKERRRKRKRGKNFF